jgi:hypothetical protein
LPPLSVRGAVKTPKMGNACLVTPTVMCVEEICPGTSRAHFGYVSTSPEPVELPFSPGSNFFTPAQPSVVVAPSSFFSGRHPAVFVVDFSGPSLSWTLGGSSCAPRTVTALASAASPTCPGSPSTCSGTVDCAGVCDGSAVVDCTGVCCGGTTSVTCTEADCTGVCGGVATCPGGGGGGGSGSGGSSSGSSCSSPRPSKRDRRNTARRLAILIGALIVLTILVGIVALLCIVAVRRRGQRQPRKASRGGALAERRATPYYQRAT